MGDSRILLLCFLLLALALGLGWVRMQPPRALGVDAPLGRFSAGRAMEVLPLALMAHYDSVPLLVTAALLAVVGGSSLARSPIVREGAVLLAAFFASAIWLQLALRFEAAVGFELSPAVTLSVGLAATTVLPAFALPRGQTRARTWAAIVAGVVMLGAVVVSAVGLS